MANPKDIYVAMRDAPADLEDTFDLDHFKATAYRVGQHLELYFEIPEDAKTAELREEIKQRLMGLDHFYAETAEGEDFPLFAEGDYEKHVPVESKLVPIPRPRKEVVVIFNKAYPELEAQFKIKPDKVHREGDRVALYFDLTLDPAFRILGVEQGFEFEPRWSFWEHPVLEAEVALTVAIIDDRLDTLDENDFESENVAVLVYEEGKLACEHYAANLAESWQWKDFSIQNWIAPTPAKPQVAFPDARAHVFIASYDLTDAEVDTLRRELPVYAIYEKHGARLLHIVTNEYGHHEDPYNEHGFDLEWPELWSVVAPIGWAIDERNGHDGDEDAKQRRFVWHSVDGWGERWDGTQDHPLWDHFGMRFERKFAITFGQ